MRGVGVCGRQVVGGRRRVDDLWKATYPDSLVASLQRATREEGGRDKNKPI